MIRIPAVDGTYELECDSNCTYREISSWLKLDLYIATLQLTQLKRMLRWAR